MKNYIDATPGVKMGESLRSLGYDAKSAIADLIDNSIDAAAKNIIVEVNAGKDQSKPVYELSIFDDGCGMTVEGLNEALTLGSVSNKSKKSSLGCFGMGLKTSATSIGRRITVITRSMQAGKVACRVYDLDVNKAQKRFVLEDRNPTKEELVRFNKFAGEGSGTWVCITKIDSKEYLNAKGLVTAIKGKKLLRLIFRKFLDSGVCNISVNTAKLTPWGYDYVEGVRVLADPFPFILADGTKLGTLKIIATLDTDHRSGHARQQGLVVVRNSRDITTNKIDWNGVSTHDWELAGVYVIWEVDASTFDNLMGTTLMKDSWRLPQAIRDAMTREISTDLKSYKDQRIAARKAKKSPTNDAFQKVTQSYNNNLNNHMNVTNKPEVKNEKLTPISERAAKETKEEPNKTSSPRAPRKPFTYADGQDQWIIEECPGCGVSGRYFMLETHRKQRGGRRFRMLLDTEHPWVAKYMLSDMSCNSLAMFAFYDSIIGDAYMELGQADAQIAENAIITKSSFLRCRALVSAAHDVRPDESVEQAA